MLAVAKRRMSVASEGVDAAGLPLPAEGLLTYAGGWACRDQPLLTYAGGWVGM